MTLFIVAMLMAALVAGCGGGDSDSSSDSSSSATTSTGTSSEVEASAEFFKPGSKNQFATFGSEAGAGEREAASSVLEENFKARAAADWATQCSSLTISAIKKIEQGAAPVGVKGCVKGLEAQALPLVKSQPVRINTLTGPIDALRVEGNKAIALYHGTKGVDYAIPLAKEEGEWKVDALVTRRVR